MAHTKHGWRTEARIRYLRRFATKHQLPYAVDDETARRMLVEPCTFCGDPPLWPNPNTLARLDMWLGYAPGNVATICPTCQLMKGDFAEREFVGRCIRIAKAHGTDR